MGDVKLVLIVLCVLFYVQTNQATYANLCPEPYSQCNLGNDGMINVHIVPHTHDDVGWLKTVDQYYYGSNLDDQDARVQFILDSVVTELSKDPLKRFVYVEIAYFWRWWNEQNDEIKQLVRTLVDEKRLEFIIGAWCMNDEATTYYQDIIDQQTLGLQFILKEFGECARPRVAWQIDPFGHSREQASLFAQFGFDGLFHGRIDYQDDAFRSFNKSREMLWQASANLGDAAKIFTGILPNIYTPPDGFCFDIYCDDDPIMDDKNLRDEYNVEQKVDDFINATFTQLSNYKTNNLIMTMGDDFLYSNARMYFKNLDKLIYYVNRRQSNGSKINIFYSTPSCYLYSLFKSNETWPVKTDDFFPYADQPHSFWTGYYTSRPALKDYIRKSNNFLQIVRQLSAITNLNDNTTQDAISTLTRAMGVSQHHDAISGTEKQHVANDYAKRLSIGIEKSKVVVAEAYNSSFHVVEFCQLLNISECLAIEGIDYFAVMFWNPLAHPVVQWVRLPVTLSNYSVFDVNTMEYTDSENMTIYNETKAIPGRQSKANSTLLFKAELPPFGDSVFIITNKLINKQEKKEPLKPKDDYSLRNKYLSLEFDMFGYLTGFYNLESGAETKFTQVICYYKSMAGNNSAPEFQASGAYVFRPDGDKICFSPREYKVTHGQHYSELHQVFNDWISQTIRLYEDSRSLEFEWLIGPIDVSDNIGKEVFTHFLTELECRDTFYTDSNGREIIKRVRNHRPTWPFNQSEPVAGNYYPVNSRIFIRDEYNSPGGSQLTICTDRTHGGSGGMGGLELMLHRRLLYDDNYGVGEALNEPGFNNSGLVVVGTFNVFFDSIKNSAKLHRTKAIETNMQPLMTFATIENDLDIDKIKKFKSSEDNTLPDNVHLLTLMKDYEVDNALIVRFEHFYELNEDPVLSEPVTFDLITFLNFYFDIIGIQELALGANMDVSELNERLNFDAGIQKRRNLRKNVDFKVQESFNVTLKPMQIRTFRVWFKPIEI